jgi:hypothetical protein
MKILIAYDGSEFADAAIHDLRHAGLPDNAEALVYMFRRKLRQAMKSRQSYPLSGAPMNELNKN